MEKFFRVEVGAKPYEDWQLWLTESKKINTVVNAFMDKHGIEANKYWYSKDGTVGEAAKPGDEKRIWFAIVPEGEDEIRLKGHLNKAQPQSGRCYFKKNSPLYKEFAQMAIENSLRRIDKPSPGGFSGFYNYEMGTTTTRLFMYKGILYGSISNENVGNPRIEGIIEMPGSEFYKILEAIEAEEKGGSSDGEN